MAVILLGAWALYRPELARPFDYVDFPENLLVLQQHQGFAAGFRALVDVYRQHGRWSPITLGLLAGQWSWFESWTPGWQLVRFGICASSAGLAFAVFRRLRLHPVGAFGAAALLVVAPAAVVGWTRLSTAEPIGLLFLLLACHFAMSPNRERAAWWLGAMLLCVMWTKEIMVVAFVLPAYLALSATPDGTLEWPRMNRRVLARLVLPTLAFVLGAVPVVVTYFTAPNGAFAARFGTADPGVTDIVGGALAAILPFLPDGTARPMALVVWCAWFALLLGGWRTALLSPSARASNRRLLLLAIGLPVLGSLAYAPWPYYILVYAMPFLAGGALLLGQAVSSLLSASGGARAFAAVSTAAVLSFAAMQSATDVARTNALHRAVALSVDRVAAIAHVDSVHVGVGRDQYDSRGNFGPRFWLYAKAMGLVWPPVVRDVTCEIARAAPPPRTLVLRLSAMCDTGPWSAASITIAYPVFAWPNPLPRSDTIRVEFAQSLENGASR